jgi:EAL and modified HD-GYP domain-containing signal transduction protein
MADAFVARQPVFDRELGVVGYELLFRSAEDNRALVVDNDDATSSVVMNTFTDFGLERVVGQSTAWINVSRTFLLERLAFALPAGRVALELLERQVIDDELLTSLRDLRDAGYTIVLDDFVFQHDLAPLVELADIVKLDLLALGVDGAAEQVRALRDFDVQLVAEKVETREEFRLCSEMGFDLFQGYFFCRPEILKGRSIGPNRLAMLQLLAAVQDDSTELAQLETLVSRDIALSYRLLRYMNSAFFGLRCRVDSVGRALALLGLNNVKRWATMTILAGIEEKPQELLTTALVRARLCELLGPSVEETNGDQLFTLGLFSVVDALMDAPMTELLRSIPFQDDMVQALTARAGRKGALLDCVIAWERGDFQASAEMIDPSVTATMHLEALTWAKRAVGELLDDEVQDEEPAGGDDDAAAETAAAA